MWIAVRILGSIAALAFVAGLVLIVLHGAVRRPIPTFPSLAKAPDTSLRGTVAYYDSATRCIRIVAAAGQPSKTVWCLPDEGPAIWAKVGKPVGPQLIWLAGGRLEVTMFRMKISIPATQGYPGLSRGWQKVIDVRTGAVHDVPPAAVPTSPDTSTQPTVNPKGERLNYTADGLTGQVKVTLTDLAGTRTLLSVHGPGEYTYQFGPVFWAPNWQWIAAADDGRILIITPGDRPMTRVLVTNSGGGAGGGTAGPTFAVTATNLLVTSK